MGTVPDGEQRANAGTGNVDGARQQRIVDRRATGQLSPVHLDLQTILLAVLLDQLLIAHHVEQQIDDTELLGNANFAFSLCAGRCDQRAGQQCGTQADGGCQAAQAG